MAVWERPAGAYTPTNHSVNVTKYQQDRAADADISSAKVDGDINKAFQGLNDIEARTAPSPVGQSGKFLSNNGTTALWTSLGALATKTQAATGDIADKAVTLAKEADGTANTLRGWNGSGVASAITTGTGLAVASGVLSPTDATTTATGSVTLATAVEVGAATNAAKPVTPATMSAHWGMPKAAVSFNGAGGVTQRQNKGIATLTRSGTGRYPFTFTTAMPDANWTWIASGNSGSGVNYAVQIQNRTATGGVIATSTPGASTAVDMDDINVLFYDIR